MDDADTDGQDQTVKKLVRYALACEYKRTKITRAGISEKGRFVGIWLAQSTNVAVIGKQRGGAFKKAFEGAQKELRTKFGMEMVVLPAKVKVTMKEKRGIIIFALPQSNIADLRQLPKRTKENQTL